MTDRLWVYPLVILTALPALLLLREASRWLVVPILRHLVVFVAAVAALFTGAAAWAWGLFLVLILLPRLAYRQAVRCAKAGRLPAAQRWRRVARCGAAEPPDTAEVPGALRGEIRLWRLWSLTGTQQWPAAIAFYEGVESWGTLGAAMQARLAVARAYAAAGQPDRAVRSLAFVALSPRTVGAMEREYRAVRALVPDHDLLRHAEEQTATWRALWNWTEPGLVTVGLLAVLGGVGLTGERWFEAFGNLPWRALEGEWYRLVTALFLHAGWEHFALNAVGFWMFGAALEKVWGRGRLLVCFLVTGAIANGLSAAVGGFDVSVGASGGVFGLVGAFGVTVYRLRGVILAAARRQLLRVLGLIVLADLVIGGLEPRIDNVAHAGGVIAGVGLALIFRWPATTRSAS